MRRKKEITFPSTAHQAVKAISKSNIPTLKWRKATKGDPIPGGTRTKMRGMSLETRYIAIGPQGSAPERLLYGWLVIHDIPFTYQKSVFGGRVPGGAVVDFVLFEKATPIVIRIQSYWHTTTAARWADEVQLAKLTEYGFQVEDVWEYEINTVDRATRTMQRILYGVPKFTGVQPGITGRTTGTAERGCPYCKYSDCVLCRG